MSKDEKQNETVDQTATIDKKDEQQENATVNEENQQKENNAEKTDRDEYKELKEKLADADKDQLIEQYVETLKELKKANEEVETKTNETIDFANRYKRTLAEMENLRKRTMQDKQDSLKYANFNIINDLLVVLDDFERAIESAKTDTQMDLQHFVDGVQMIEKQFIDLLFKKYGVVKYCEKGEEFDPNIHLAMMAEEGDYDKEEIIEVFRKGYSLHDRVIRPAQVKIGKPKA